MKTTKKILNALLVCLLLIGCSKDDNPPIENKAPSAFEVRATPTGNSVLLQWTQATDPDGDTVKYSVQLGDDMILSNSSVTEHTVNDLEFATPYSGKVMASDPKGLSSEASFDFITGDSPNASPKKFTLTFPVGGVKKINILPELKWEAATDPDGDTVTYDLYLDTNTEPTTLIVEGLTDTSFTITTALENNTEYFWKVAAKDGMDGETASETTSFTTIPVSPATAIQATSDAGFFVRHGHSTVEFDDKMWVIGGTNGNNATYNDIWQSDNGVNWSKVEPVGEIFTIRTDHSCLVFNNKMWVIGGRWNTTSYNDVWYTEDGVNWTEATENAGFEARYAQASTVYNGRMWIFGGRSNTQSFPKEAWSSTDGINWTVQSATIASSFKADAQVVVFDDKMWKLGGQDEGSDDVFYSTNGTDWTLAKENAPFGPRSKHTAVVYDGKMWLLGGTDHTNGNIKFHDVWFSDDGETWTRNTGSAGYIARANASSAVFDNKIWIIAGAIGFNNLARNDVWYLDFEQ